MIEQKHILKVFRDQFSGSLVISTQDRRGRDIVPIAEIDDHFDEPMRIEQRQFAKQMVERWNGYDTIAAKTKELEVQRDELLAAALNTVDKFEKLPFGDAARYSSLGMSRLRDVSAKIEAEKKSTGQS